MSTRSIIAVRHGDGFTDGIYVHDNGYPTGRGPDLYAAVHHFGGAGPFWAAFTEATGNGGSWLSMHSFAEANESKWLPDLLDSWGERVSFVPFLGVRINEQTFDPFSWKGGTMNTDCEWAYAIDLELNTMGVFQLERVAANFTKAPRLVGVANFGRDEPDWGVMECGPKYEHCTHVACYHFPETEAVGADQLGTDKWLGYEPLEVRDAIALIDELGRQWRLTGSGHLERDGYGGYTKRWFASCELVDLGELKPPDHDGPERRSLVDVGHRTDRHVWNVYKTVPAKAAKDITLVYPPTAATTA